MQFKLRLRYYRHCLTKTMDFMRIRTYSSSFCVVRDDTLTWLRPFRSLERYVKSLYQYVGTYAEFCWLVSALKRVDNITEKRRDHCECCARMKNYLCENG